MAHPTNRKWVITPVISGLTLQKSHVNHWGYNPLTSRGMSHQVLNQCSSHHQPVADHRVTAASTDSITASTVSSPSFAADADVASAEKVVVSAWPDTLERTLGSSTIYGKKRWKHGKNHGKNQPWNLRLVKKMNSTIRLDFSKRIEFDYTIVLCISKPWGFI